MRISRTMARDVAASLLLGTVLAACTGDLPTAEPSVGHAVLNKNGGTPTITPVALGKSIYFDANMSRNRNQACASCHAAAWGFTGPGDGSIRTQGGTFAFFEGSIPGRFGGRKPPAAAYASFSPVQRFTTAEGYIGGLFWDGRARGSRALTPIQEQVLGPFKADKEHAFSRVCILWEINKAYGAQFNQLSPTKLTSIPFSKVGTATVLDAYCHTGTADLPDSPPQFNATDLTNLTNAYNYVGVLVGAFEASPEVNRFASKWDDVQAARATFTAEELLGREVFNDNCETCHSSNVAGGAPQVFNDHEFYNLGLPRNPLQRALAPDRGLGAVVNNAAYNGFFRNATTRNVDKRPFPGAPKTFMHNGVFTSLEQVVHFYNTRDTKACPAGVTYGAGWQRFPTPADPVSARLSGICWPAPDYPATMDDKLGNMGMTAAQEQAVIRYMVTMTDR